MSRPEPPSHPDDPRLLGAAGGADLQRWAADGRADEAAAARSRERWLRRQADEDATFAGVLLDLAEQQVPVVVHLRGGRRHAGATVTGIGADFVTLHVAGRDVLVASAAIVSVRPAPATAAPRGDRVPTTGVRFADAIAAAADRDQRVTVVGIGDVDGVTGSLVRVGSDVVTVRLDGPAAGVAYVALASIGEVTIC